jgi:TPR repeat protein
VNYFYLIATSIFFVLSNFLPASAQAQTNLFEACANEDGEACSELQSLYQIGGITLPHDPVISAQSFSSSCKNKIAVGCRKLGNLYMSGHGVSQDKLRAGNLYAQACQLGDLLGCTLHGVYHVPTGDHPNDLKRIATGLQRACESGEMKGCFVLAEAYSLRKDVFPENQQDIFLNHERACNGGIVQSCRSLSDYYYRGIDTNVDIEKSIRFFLKACSYDDTKDRCTSGFVSRYHTNYESDRFALVDKFRIECAADDASSCDNLGFITFSGYGAPRNFRNADEFYRKACQLGDAHVCHFLATQLRKVDREDPEAVTLLQSACDQQILPACVQLASHFERKAKGQAKDDTDFKVEANSLYVKACDGGNPEACSKLFRRSSKEPNAIEFVHSTKTLIAGCMFGFVAACREL